jgi:hypothetical protein
MRLLTLAGWKRQHGDKDMLSNWRSPPRPSEKSLEQLCQEGTQVPCCTEDEGGPFGASLQGAASNNHKLLRSQGRGGERYGKGAALIASCMGWRDERK